jgi:hypothetical protein
LDCDKPGKFKSSTPALFLKDVVVCIAYRKGGHQMLCMQ